jgi:nucleotide-binding universal stress UspA family protein
MVRLSMVPVLVMKGAPIMLRRVLAAVDLSHAAGPTMREAERFAELENGRLRAIHVPESVMTMPEIAQFVDQPRFNAESAAVLEREVWPLLRLPKAERALRAGDAVSALSVETIEWKADLLVLGSHGRGWADRIRLGTVTERLLNQLPVSLLVVPTRRADWRHHSSEEEMRVAAHARE